MAQVVPSLTSLPLDSTVAPTSEDIQNRLPSICVDYLSHDWAEEDVWASWRNMTRHKNEIANGVRLENASWRTWWKQRNKLRTISPETLNWLKDSDVTWLYGPLHTAVEPVPPPKVSSTDDRLGIVRSSTTAATNHTKPILKHRTLSELLTIPTPNPSSPILEAVSYYADDDVDEYGVSVGSEDRPPLLHTRSDTNIIRRTQRKESPPRDPIGSGGRTPVGGVPSESLDGVGELASTRRGPHSGAHPAKRHISFNTFVEQCIAVDDPADVAEIEQATRDEQAIVYAARAGEDEEDDDDDEDDVLEMRAGSSASSRASSSSRSARSSRSGGGGGGRNDRPTWSRTSSSASSVADHMTIAKIAPTTLKTLGNFAAPSPQVSYHPPGLSSAGSSSGSDYAAEHGDEDTRGVTYRHDPSPGRHPQQPPVAAYDFPSPRTGNEISSPMPWGSQTEEDEYGVAGFDYFHGPDLGVGDEYNNPKGARHNASVPGPASSSTTTYGTRNSGTSTPTTSVTPQVGQAPHQPKWRTGGNGSTQPSPSASSTARNSPTVTPGGVSYVESGAIPIGSPTLSANGVGGTGKGILKIRPPGYAPPAESSSPTSSYFNFNPSVATGFGAMGHGTQRLPREPISGSLPLYDAHNTAVANASAPTSTTPPPQHHQQHPSSGTIPATPTSPTSATDGFERGRAFVRSGSIAERSLSRGTGSTSTSLSPNAARLPLSIPSSGSGTSGIAASAAGIQRHGPRPTTIDTSAPTTTKPAPPLATPSQSSSGSASPGYPFPSSPLAVTQRTRPMEETGPGETSHTENIATDSADSDDQMDVDHSPADANEPGPQLQTYLPERGSTPTPHSSPQIAFRPLLDTSPASLPHAAGPTAGNPILTPASAIATLEPVTSNTSSTASLKRHHSRSPSLPSTVGAQAKTGESALRRISGGQPPIGDDGEEGGSMLGRAVTIANTAKDLFGALWSYGGQSSSQGGSSGSGGAGNGSTPSKE